MSEGTPSTVLIQNICSAPDFHGRCVLLAEDNELNREIAQTILEMNGLRVECAANGQEALDLFCCEPPGRFDAILMDIRMPVMDGLEATRRLRTSGRPDARTIPIIALSANAFDEDSKKSIASGMNGHLSKPIEVDKLLDVLEQCMRGDISAQSLTTDSKKTIWFENQIVFLLKSRKVLPNWYHRRASRRKKTVFINFVDLSCRFC